MTHAVRTLLERPAFTALAVLTLAIGIGATTAVFSVLNGVLLRPLPYPNPDRLVGVWERTLRAPRVQVSFPNFRDWHDRTRGFGALAAYGGDTTTVLGGNEPVFADAYVVTKEFFKVLGVPPAVGRTFTADETTPHGPAAVVVSDRFWRRSLNGNRDLASVRLGIHGVSARVVGVMPPGFAFPAGADLWMPQEREPDESGRTAHKYSVIGRLRTSFERADSELAMIASELRLEHPGDDDAESITMLPLQEAVTGASRTALLILLGSVALVLLIACATVANTMLARGRGSRGAARRTVRNVLVSAEAAVALVLIVAAALLIHSFWKLLSVDTGFEPTSVVAMEMVAPETKYPTPDDSAQFYERLLEQVRTVPGVEFGGRTTRRA